MNPRAVQSERPNESTSNCDFGYQNFGVGRNSTVSVENYFNRRSTGHVQKAQSKSVQTQCCFMDEHFTEIDDLKYFTSISKSWRVKKELPSVDNNNAVQSLLDLERNVFDRVDDCQNTRSQTHKQLKSDQCNNTFTAIFNDPGTLSKRTKITPTGLKIAQLSDSTSDWRRCLVLFIDFLKALPDIQLLNYQDQVHLAEARYSAFGWWLCAIWTLKSGCNGVCYSNGTYFPRDSDRQCIFDQRGVCERMFYLLVEPLKALQISEEERVLFSVIVIFSLAVSNISEEGTTRITQIREKYLKMLYQHICENSTKVEENDVFAAVRVGNMLLLISSIMELVHMTGDNILLNDALQYMQLDTFGVYDKLI